MHLAAETVIDRLSNFMDAEALRAIADGVQITLDSIEAAQACAPILEAKLRELTTTGVPAEVTAEIDPVSEKPDRKSTRLNSSHSQISYAVFCLKKKTRLDQRLRTALPP